MSKTIEAKALIEVTKEMFENMYTLKTYCDSQKNCHDCKIREECKSVCDKTLGNDISCIDICRVEDPTWEGGYRYYYICS